ncbi:MAG: PilZ domain-containing protein [Chitinispirillales bacterium]|jgi:c-di-GMP-binding flagellar brake protein YcgR|nr:PilZ domain-containing protein [Chitinispirillales bacterium]
MKKFFSPLFFCLLSAVPALSQSPQSPITKIGWHGPDRSIVIAIGIFFSIAIGILISFYIAHVAKRAKIEREASEKLFNDGCERCQLKSEEIKLLRKVAAYAPEAQTKSHQIFEMRVLFERCIDTYVINCHRSAQATEDDDEILGNIRKKLGYAVIATDVAILSTRNISVGQKVSIFVDKPAIGKSAMVSSVTEFHFTLRQPQSYGAERYPLGAEMTIAFMRQGDATYSATAKVKDTSPSGEEATFYHTLKLSRSQNRRYLRLDASLPIKYRVLEKVVPGEIIVKKGPSEVFQARTFDIGGGGLSFVTGEMHLVGDEIQLALTAGGRVLAGIKARILHIIPVGEKADDDSEWKHRYLVQFTAIEPQVREHIIKYIFEKQREMLQQR